jgi:hypothetical protein
MMRSWVALAVSMLVLTGSAYGEYSYYYSEPAGGWASWTQNGVVSTGPDGFTSADANGGSLISTAYGAMTEHEVKTRYKLPQSGGTFVQYLSATANAKSGPAAAGSFYSVELQNVDRTGGSCVATLSAYRTVNAAATLLSSTVIACHDGMEIQSVRIGTSLDVRVDGMGVLWLVDSVLTSGYPGVGVIGANAANTISDVWLGQIEHDAPQAVDRSSIGLSAYPDAVHLQWQPPSDGPDGTGITAYLIYRGGQYINATRESAFSDPSVQPSTQYEYWIMVSVL